jgi:phenylalanine-4-hydroxylase
MDWSGILDSKGPTVARTILTVPTVIAFHIWKQRETLSNPNHMIDPLNPDMINAVFGHVPVLTENKNGRGV